MKVEQYLCDNCGKEFKKAYRGMRELPNFKYKDAFPVSAFEMADQRGLDLCEDCLWILQKEYCDPIDKLVNARAEWLNKAAENNKGENR